MTGHTEEVQIGQRVLFDAYWWFGGPPSGAMLVKEIVKSWVGTFPDDDLLVVVPRRDKAMVSLELSGKATVVGARLRPHGIFAMFELPLLAIRNRADVTFAQNFGPIFGESVVFLQDVLFRSNPEWFTRSERQYFKLMSLSLRFATKVVASSQSESGRILQFYPGLKSISVVGLGMRRDILDAAPKRPMSLGGVTDFLLTVGRLNARKNLERIILGAIHSGEISEARPLVLAGGIDGKFEQLPIEISKKIEERHILVLGHVSEGELRWLYESARLFIFLSLDEGFGLPPLEAAHFGAPVLASDIAVLRETLGTYADYVDPSDVEAISNAISKKLSTAGIPVSPPVPRSWESIVENIKKVCWSL